MTRIAIIGATSGIATAVAREWAARPDVSFRLVGRSDEKLDRLAADLRARGAASVETSALALDDATAVAAAVDWSFIDGPVDLALIAFGDMPSQEEADASPEVAAHLLSLNGTMNALAAHLATLRLVAAGTGTLGVIGSVAGDRGRQSNYLYGSAKAMVATAVAGLQHRVAGTGVSVVLIKPGPTATPMTDHLRGGKLALAPVEQVGREIVLALDKGTPVLYTPGKWRIIMAIIRNLPRALFHRTKL
ncbi:MAG: SDR family NAD(P)-dependent oxidoreductase [Nocardioides sp.]|uniref:SDR family NAD(P)-dependent oxidoreductase n=1 Tax=Nocardioides sp. TaxID=35761 RepID=UPI0039E6F715